MLQWLTDGEPTVAVLEFVTVGTDHTAFLSGSVKGGGRLEGTFGKPTTHYKLRITKKTAEEMEWIYYLPEAGQRDDVAEQFHSKDSEIQLEEWWSF